MSASPPETRLPRPRQLTTGVVMAVVTSLVLVLSLFDTLGSLRSSDTRQAVEEVLGDPALRGWDVGTGQVLEAMRVLALVSGALAAVVLVCAVFVWQRHRGARIALTVAAALLVLTVPVTGFLPVFVAFAVALVWTRPARDWYAGRRPVAAESSDPGRTERPDLPASPAPPTYPAYPDPQTQPDQQTQTVQPDPWAGSWPPPAPGYPPQAPGYPPPWPGPAPSSRDPHRRPTTVTVAAVLTWIGAGLVALGMLGFMVLLAADGSAFVEEFDTAAAGTQVDLTRDQVVAVGWVVAATFLFWALAAIVLAVFAVRRSQGARIGLAVSAAMSTLFSLLSILSGVAVVTLLLSGAALVLLFTGGANAWYAGRPGGSGQPAPPPTFTQPGGRNQPW